MFIKAKHINVLHVTGIISVGLILTIPAIFYSFFDAHDLLEFHSKWSKHFVEQFWAGDLYPRWLLGMNAGLGGPTFFFYAPVPYYVTSLLHPLFSNEAQGWHQLSLAASIALVASGLTAYIWLKSITNRNVAFISSIVYMAFPYHLAVDLYWRFAFAEYWTFVWIPLILYFSKKITGGHRLSVVGLAVSFALLIMTHLPTLIIFSPVPIFYVVSMVDRKQRKKVLIRLAMALILAVGLSAVYWLPAMTTQQYISMNAIKEGMYYYKNLFLFSNPPFPHDKIFWRYLEILTLLMGGLACCAFALTRSNPSAIFKRESNYWIVVAMVALFMTLPLSRPVWDALPVVQRIQFSWRFNSILTVASTALLALGISSVRLPVAITNKKLAFGVLLLVTLFLSVVEVLPVLQEKLHFPGTYNTVLLLVGIAFTLWGVSSLKQPVAFSNQKNLCIVSLLIASLLLSSGIVIKKRLYKVPDNVDTVLQTSMDAAEYRPKWVSPDIFHPNTVSQLGNLAKATVATGQGSLLIQRWQPRDIVLQTNSTTDLWLNINQFYYPGWTARLDGARSLPLQPSPREGLLRVQVPSGKHTVRVTLDAGIQERSGQISSTISVVALLLFWFRKGKQVRVYRTREYQTAGFTP